jgi:hypothetical protein
VKLDKAAEPALAQARIQLSCRSHAQSLTARNGGIRRCRWSQRCWVGDRARSGDRVMRQAEVASGGAVAGAPIGANHSKRFPKGGRY